ncbi:carboxypeptidase-like regulatory domain-containing protein, partial [Candidatus Marithioploca araucensis]|nr:carboxypeptidase-like regulatory domain-containing protein [Candidatus Marithioploca araucensis]
MSDSYYRREHTDLVHNLEPPKRRWRFFVNWLFDSLMPSVLVVSTVGANSLKSPASIWRGVVFVVFIMGMMAIFAGNQVQATSGGISEYFAGTVNVPNATVRINETVGTTNSDGSFGFHAARADKYAISVSKPGYALDSKIEKWPSMTLSFTLKKAVLTPIRIDQLSK